MLIRDLFFSDVTRDIPPVVHFHEQSPAKLAAEVGEYIITGGWPNAHPNHARVPDGIHEQYIRLLTGIISGVEKPGGPELPNVWISGFYGSGKSSFAKLFGLALDGVALPDGTSVADAWLKRDQSPNASKLRDAWRALRQKIEPMAVVFDIGGVARDHEHLHSAAVRQVQRRLGYCSTEPLVADFELRLERDGEWTRFEQTALEMLGAPWSTFRDRQLAEDQFSLVLSRMFPKNYTDPMSWIEARGGTHSRIDSPEDAVRAIADMLKFRRPGATLFLVVDEVSQYVLSQNDRVERLRAFAEQLGSRMKGRVWLLALGQQKLDEEADDSFLVKTKDSFPPRLRVHLAPTNIRDVIHQRLLRKKDTADKVLRELFERHRPDLKLYAYGGDATADAFVDVYPMLPGQIDLILQITTALRTRSLRAQGDDQAIRGLLQLLGELFRSQRLADREVGALVTLDQIYEVQHTALDADVQASMARVLGQPAGDPLKLRAAKAVALLELIQETLPTTADLVAKCLYDRVDRGNNVAEVTEALEGLRRANLLGYSEKEGYKIQSTAGEEWERDRRDIGASGEAKSEIVQQALRYLFELPERPRLQGRPFPWEVRFSDGRRADHVRLVDPRDDASMVVDLWGLTREESADSAWVRRSDEPPLRDRLVWLAGNREHLDGLATELHRSRATVEKYEARRESLSAARKLLLQHEKNRVEELEKKVREAAADAWMDGRMFFRARPLPPADYGGSFAAAANAAAARVLPDLFPNFVATQVLPAELMTLLNEDLSAPSPKFVVGELGILDLDAGRYVAACTGIVPRRVQDYIEKEGGVTGTTLLGHFGGPPYGYTTNVVKACVAGLLQARKVRIQPEGLKEITARRDPGVKELFDKDRDFRRATFFPAGADDIGFQTRARICTLFEGFFGGQIDRDDNAIANIVAAQFPKLIGQLRSVEARLNRLPGSPETPPTLRKLGDAIEKCLSVCRETAPAVREVKAKFDALRDGFPTLRAYHAELTDAAIRAAQDANDALQYEAAQLEAAGEAATNVGDATSRVKAQIERARPWDAIGSLDDDLKAIRGAYVAERTRLLQWQEREAEVVRLRVRGRDGFSTLTADQAHQVVRPIEQALTATAATAVAPALVELQDPFQVRLRRAEDDANGKLDAYLSVGAQPIITAIDLHLRNRVVTTEADVEAIVAEIRGRLLDQIKAGGRVRLT